jgi:hypothetical protein
MLLIAPTTATGIDQKMIIKTMKVVVPNFLAIRSLLPIRRFFQTISFGVAEIARGFIFGAFLGVILLNAASAACWVVNSTKTQGRIFPSYF